jgi:squalene-hopene/tetraprenyl-beta-curcumene cyclase
MKLSMIFSKLCLFPLTWSLVMMCAFEATVTAATPKTIENAIMRASQYLRESGQQSDGSFSPKSGPAITALCITALVRTGTPVDSQMVSRAVAYLLTFQQSDGGIYQPESAVANYETSIAILALQECNSSGQYEEIIQKARQFLTGIQWDESEGNTYADPEYGGAGYGRHERPDLSNTAFLIDALKGVGASSDDPAIQRALIFVSRSQNLEGVYDILDVANKNPDGGFFYTPANGGESQAGTTPTGGLRSYGSMTYSGLRSMIYAGVSADDPRVVAAIEWLKQHYTFAENPGMGDAGLFYYFHTAAKALHVLGQDQVIGIDGKAHDWRKDLVGVLLSAQNKNGSWVNNNSRWLEGDANLVTSYALLALSYCQPSISE